MQHKEFNKELLKIYKDSGTTMHLNSREIDRQKKHPTFKL